MNQRFQTNICQRESLGRKSRLSSALRLFQTAHLRQKLVRRKLRRVLRLGGQVFRPDQLDKIPEFTCTPDFLAVDDVDDLRGLFLAEMRRNQRDAHLLTVVVELNEKRVNPPSEFRDKFLGRQFLGRLRDHILMREEHGEERVFGIGGLQIGAAFGIDAVKDTYNRAFNEWKSNYKYLTDLVMVLNHKSWQWYEKNDERAELYNDLWDKTAQYAMDHLEGEELSYYFRVTD